MKRIRLKKYSKYKAGLLELCLKLSYIREQYAGHHETPMPYAA